MLSRLEWKTEWSPTKHAGEAEPGCRAGGPGVADDAAGRVLPAVHAPHDWAHYLFFRRISSSAAPTETPMT
jgi:hypothetical protein